MLKFRMSGAIQLLPHIPSWYREHELGILVTLVIHYVANYYFDAFLS